MEAREVCPHTHHDFIFALHAHAQSHNHGLTCLTVEGCHSEEYVIAELSDLGGAKDLHDVIAASDCTTTLAVATHAAPRLHAGSEAIDVA